MTYTLWCPDMDGTQHFCGDPTTEPGAWDHQPTTEELIDRATPDIIAEGLTGARLRERIYSLTQTTFTPTTCHFDKQDDDEGQYTGWPDHWHPWSSGRNNPRWLGRFLNHAADAYPDIKRMYRCSIHGKPPKKISIRSAHEWENRWHGILTAKYNRIQINRADDERLLALTQERIDNDYPNTMGNHPYSFRYITGWVAKRPSVRTSHDLW